MKESFHWVRSCILSSTNEFHLKCCRNLIDLFEYQYQEKKECDLMVADLTTELREKETFLTIEV